MDSYGNPATQSPLAPQQDIDSYGAPVAPVAPPKDIDGYGAPLAPIIEPDVKCRDVPRQVCR